MWLHTPGGHAQGHVLTLTLMCAPQWAVNRLQNVLRLTGALRTGFLPLAQTNVTDCSGDFWSRSVVNREVRRDSSYPTCYPVGASRYCCPRARAVKL